MEAFNPLVSIIIPCYNSGHFIAGTIQSALNQTWKNKEIIVVDDGSTDNSYLLAKAYETQGPVQVYLQDNGGSCAARNKGFDLSKGAYIQYLDADDLLSENKIEAQMGLLKNFSREYISDCPWGKFHNSPLNAEFNSDQLWKDFSPVEWLIAAWTGGAMMQTGCWLTPRHIIELAGPWNETLKKNPNDDGEFFCRVLLQSSGIKFCSDAKVFYRFHSNDRVSTGKNQTAVTSLLETCVLYEKNILQKEDSERTRKAVAASYAYFMYNFYDYFPSLAQLAAQHIRRLGFKNLPAIGGKNFIRISKIIGFQNSLHLRAVLKGLRTVQKN